MTLVRKALATCLSQTILVGSDKRFIFIYHDVSNETAFQFSNLCSTSVPIFVQQIEFLARRFELVSLDDVLSPETKRQKRRLAAITFDDGFLSVRDTAFPILSAKGIPFATFVNRLAISENRLFNDSGDSRLEIAGEERVFLDEADMIFLSRKGVTIGNHSATHRRLIKCDEGTLREEIDDNKVYLEQLIGKPVYHFALPFGKHEHYDEQVLAHCYRAGHKYVYSSNPTFFDLSSDCYKRRLIPRIGLTNETPANLLFMINRPLFKTIDI